MKAEIIALPTRGETPIEYRRYTCFYCKKVVATCRLSKKSIFFPPLEKEKRHLEICQKAKEHWQNNIPPFIVTTYNV